MVNELLALQDENTRLRNRLREFEDERNYAIAESYWQAKQEAVVIPADACKCGGYVDESNARMVSGAVVCDYCAVTRGGCDRSDWAKDIAYEREREGVAKV